MSTVAKLYIWRDRSLLLSSIPIPQKEFTATADQLVVSLQGEIKVHTKDEGIISGRTFLIRAGTRVGQNVSDGSNSVPAVCYLNPIGQDYSVLKQLMTTRAEEALAHHPNEDEIIKQLLFIRDNNVDSNQTYQTLDNLIIPPEYRDKVLQKFDPRIIEVMQLIKDTVKENLSIAELAEKIFLSESRLVKLFKQQIGIPITRYRLRYRVHLGVVHLSLGRSVTEAALEAGFSSTAHFSKCYSAMLGLQPSSSGFVRAPFIDIILAEDIIANLTSPSQ